MYNVQSSKRQWVSIMVDCGESAKNHWRSHERNEGPGPLFWLSQSEICKNRLEVVVFFGGGGKLGSMIGREYVNMPWTWRVLLVHFFTSKYLCATYSETLVTPLQKNSRFGHHSSVIWGSPDPPAPPTYRTLAVGFIRATLATYSAFTDRRVHLGCSCFADFTLYSGFWSIIFGRTFKKWNLSVTCQMVLTRLLNRLPLYRRSLYVTSALIS